MLTAIFKGVFTPSDDLAKEVFDASEVSGEKLWRLPIEESYWESMKSGVADMVNTGGRQGGAITAALFLKQVMLIILLFLLSHQHKYIMVHCNQVVVLIYLYAILLCGF